MTDVGVTNVTVFVIAILCVVSLVKVGQLYRVNSNERISVPLYDGLRLSESFRIRTM